MGEAGVAVCIVGTDDTDASLHAALFAASGSLLGGKVKMERACGLRGSAGRGVGCLCAD